MAKTEGGSGQLAGLAEGLGDFLGKAEAQWESWRGEREAVVKSLTEIRDRAARLLSEAGDAVSEGAARRGRGPVSAESRARMAQAQRARWAAVRAKKK